MSAMTDEEARRIEYARTRRGIDRYERNGWIGLAVTLALCVIAYVLVYVMRR